MTTTPRPAALLTLLVAVLLAGCSTADDPQPAAAPPTEAGVAETATSAPSAAATSEPAPTPTAVPSPTATTPDAADHLDPAPISQQISAEATGDPEWIAVLADLLAEDWLLGRYPGELDPHQTYEESWSTDTADATQRQLAELDGYIDQAVPNLVSVELSRELGPLVELEAVVSQPGPSFVQLNDGTVGRNLPTGESRGLFTISESGAAGKWRIHSIVDLGATP